MVGKSANWRRIEGTRRPGGPTRAAWGQFTALGLRLRSLFHPNQDIFAPTVIAAAVFAQASGSVWDGVCMDAQPSAVKRCLIRTAFMPWTGIGGCTPLSGGEPSWAWSGKPMTALFDKIHKEMPHDRPGTSFRRVEPSF